MTGPRLLWIDVSAGVAGDMLLAALIDLGADPAALQTAAQAAVDAVVPATVRLTSGEVTRAGLRARSLQVELLAADQPHRSWAEIRSLLLTASLPDAVRERALAAFAALARAEAHVHGVAVDDVHFHEVGAWDSVADVVGVCAAIVELDVDEVVVGALALGSGSVRTAHGLLPVPAPAVAELVRGWPVVSDGDGELATPTGVALLTTLATGRGPLPATTVEAVGYGAGTRDRADRPNVVRVILGRTADRAPERDRERDTDRADALEPMALLETNVDDLDPRVWPSVIDDLLAAGAADVWLTPVLMKKGRPGQVLAVLAAPELAPALRRLVLDRTSSLGVRQSEVVREVLDRRWVDVDVEGGTVPVKIGYRDGVVVHATPEFEDVARRAAATGRPVGEVLAAANARAHAAGLSPGHPLPEHPVIKDIGSRPWAFRRRKTA